MGILTSIGTKTVTFDVSASATLSSAASLEDCTLVGIFMPATWTSADITFQVSHDNVTYVPMYDEDGTEVTISVDTSRYVALLDGVTLFAGVSYIKLQSGVTGSTVNQAADTTITLIVRPL